MRQGTPTKRLRFCEQPDVDAVARQRPLGLVTDIDGTISRIASTPEAAVVDARCREALRALADRLDLVAAVSGRAAAEARRMVGLDGLVYVGNHGLERWQDGDVVPTPGAAEYRPAIAEALAELRAGLQLPGVLFEDKGLVVAIHYRQAAKPSEARAAILAEARKAAVEKGLLVAEGKRVVELRPPVARDKGEALASLVTERRLGAVIYLGDDRTDVAALRRLRQLRRAGDCASLGVAVLEAETPAALLREADCSVTGVDGVAELLEWLAETAVK